MKHASALVILAYLSEAYASPTLQSRATPESIAEKCTNVRLENDWLIGDCLTGSDSTTRITSGTYLREKIGNENGNLVWNARGYVARCNDCRIVNTSKLNCNCQPNSGSPKQTTLSLEEHIGVYSGHLLSNLRSEPVVPSAPSKYGFPSDTKYGYGGNATCPDGVFAPDDSCNEASPSCTDAAANDLTETVFTTWAPHPDCFVSIFYLPDHYAFQSLKLAAAGAWELKGYADEACTEELVVIGNDDKGKCQAPRKLIKAIKTRPLFNGDPSL